jgi:hypothetical protein
MNPNDYSDYPLNSPKYYEFKIRFTDQDGNYNDGRVRIKVKAKNDPPTAYDNNTLASEYKEEDSVETVPAPLNVDNLSDNWGDMNNNAPEKRNKILLQASDIEDTIDNLTFYAVSQLCKDDKKADCTILEKGSPTRTTDSDYAYRGKRELHIRPWNNLSYRLYTTVFYFKVRDGGKYGVYHNGSNFVISNDKADSAKQKIGLTLFGLNDQPVASNLSVNVSEGVQNAITLKGTDEDRDDKIDNFTITTLPDPKYGYLHKLDNTTISLNEKIEANASDEATIYYRTHDNLSSGLAAVDTFTYTATDDSPTDKSDPRQPDLEHNEPKESDNATVQLTIYGANDRPTAGAVSDNLTEDVSKGTTLTFADIDKNDVAKYYTITSLPTRGDVYDGNTLLTNTPHPLPVGTNSVTVRPHQSLAKDQIYSDSFNYRVTDNSSTTVLHQETHDDNTSAENTVSLTITGVNDAPVADNADQGDFAYGQTTKTFSLTGSDVDGDNISFALTKQPVYAQLSSFNQANGAVNLGSHSFSFPNVRYQETLNFYVKDVHNAVSENATVTFNVLGPGCTVSAQTKLEQTVQNTTDADAFLSKHDRRGTHLWTLQIGTSAEDVSLGTTTDLFGNIFLAGYTGGALTDTTNAGGLDAFLIKFSDSGRELWRRQFGSPGDEVALALTTDAEGDVYVVGQTSSSFAEHSSAGEVDLYLIKFDSGGLLQWSQQWGTTGHDLGAELALDVNGQLNLLGLSVLDGPRTQVEYFYSRFDSSTGELLWTLPLETEVPVASGLSLDYTGSAYLAHPYSNELNSNEAPVLEYRPD